MTNGSGNVVERYEYDDYGRPTIMDPQGNPRATSAIGNVLMFQGRQYDPETGFYWYRTRYYDPRAGRFTSRDTIGIWGDPLNLGNGYTFVGNNPWTWLDPYGLEIQMHDFHLRDGRIRRHYYDVGWFSHTYKGTYVFNPCDAEEAHRADKYAVVQNFLTTANKASGAAIVGMKASLAVNPVANGIEAVTGESMTAPAGTKLGVVDRSLAIAAVALPVTKLAKAGKVADAANDLNRGKKALTAADLEADAKKVAGMWDGVCKLAGDGTARNLVRKVFTTLDDFKAARTFASAEEAETAWRMYKEGAGAAKGILIGHGDAPIKHAIDGWQAFRMRADKYSEAINMAWIDGAIDAGKPVRLVTPFDEVRRGSVTWDEIQRVISRGGTLIGGP